MTIRNHRDLEVWQLSMDVVDEIYVLSRKLPRDERYGLISQLRRAACSVPMNIAEGKGRGTRKDFAHFVSVAKGSVLELDTVIEVCIRQRYLSVKETETLRANLFRLEQMLSKLRSRLIGVTHGVD